MNRKPGSIFRAQIDADVGRTQDNAGSAGLPDVRRRPRLTDGSGAQRHRKAALARTLGPGTATIIEPGLHVVDELPQAIPPTQRELEVIETYLGALLDAVLGRPN
jgi:hypothetical protein